MVTLFITLYAVFTERERQYIVCLKLPVPLFYS